MKASFPKKLMSLRDKNGSHRRSKSSEPGHKARPLSADVFFSYFRSDAAKQAAREEEEKERTAANVELIASRIDEMRFHSITRDHIRFALLSKYSEGDVDKAIDLIRLQQQAFSGTLLPYNPNVSMLGAENREFVTCYLDALLFAMYAKLEAFDCMLKNDQLNDNQRNLAALLRLWVNMLRSGKLIRTDIVGPFVQAALLVSVPDLTEKIQMIQEALASCGWQDAARLEQQDTSEAFAFITETLQLPLLTLQVDLFHQGQNDAQDHKVVYERLLNLAVPPDPEGKGVKLEDCLEEYFNTRVDVLRDSPEDKKAAERASLASQDTALRLVTAENGSVPQPETSPVLGPDPGAEPKSEPKSDDAAAATAAAAANDAGAIGVVDSSNAPDRAGKGEPAQTAADADETTDDAAPATCPPSPKTQPQDAVSSESFDRDPAPMRRRWTMLEPHALAPENRTGSSSTTATIRSVAGGRQRSASIIQRIVIENGQPSAPQDPSTLLEQVRRQGSTIIKAVTIPAWQFFRLIPWHSTSNSEPQNDIEVVRQFNKRPVVGICLKRYMMNQAGQFLRHNTYIDIPDSLRLPYFMMAADGRSPEEHELSAEYKLVLQSVVCHRGMTLHSGHYVSFARVNPKLLTDNRRHQLDPPPDYEEQQWVKFDDLDLDSRVTYVDDIKVALKSEMPYLLFYQIVPMVDPSPPSTEGNETYDPPSYNASTVNIAGDRSEASVSGTGGTGGTGSSHIDSAAWGSSSATTGPSIRFSSEQERPSRVSFDDRRTTEGASRRGSLGFTSSVSGTPILTPEGGRSPVIAPSDEPSTAQRLSRAAARLTGKAVSRSRPPSQAGEGRISLTMARLGGLVRTSKEPLRHSEDGAEAPTSLTATSLQEIPSAANSTLTIPSAGGLSAEVPLTTVYTAPAAALTSDQLHGPDLLLSASAGPSAHPVLPQRPADSQPEDTGRQHHHHHHFHHHQHHHRRRSKSKSRPEKDGDVDSAYAVTDSADFAATGSGSGKGKDKEKPRNKMGVPERECLVM